MELDQGKEYWKSEYMEEGREKVYEKATVKWEVVRTWSIMGRRILEFPK